MRCEHGTADIFFEVLGCWRLQLNEWNYAKYILKIDFRVDFRAAIDTHFLLR